jgi:UDP:flavonoid glycosyltransferase YjiC (YdhE family)
MVPLAAALQERGHDVAFATGETFGAAVRRAGFEHFACGSDSDGSQDILECLPEWEAIRAASPANVGLQQLNGFVRGLAPPMAEDLISLIDTWKPGVIVRDPLEFGGYVAAEHHRLPYATIIWATYIPAQFLCPEAVLWLRRRFGLPDDPALETLDRYLVFDFLPPSWQVPDLPYPPVAHRFCAPPFDMGAGASLPEWLAELPDRPTVYATLGTTFNRAPAVFRSILDALSTEPLNLILTVGRSVDPDQFGPQPDNVRIERYVAQTLVLPRCAAVLFHGGYNTLHSALWHGLPMVVAPMGAGDQLPTGWRCAATGAGVMVEGDPPSTEAFRAAVRAVLAEPTYRARAGGLQREMQALPSLAEAVKRLELLASAPGPQFT